MGNTIFESHGALGFANSFFPLCTNPRVVQRCVHRDAVRRAALFRGRCEEAGAVETQARTPASGVRKLYHKLGRSLGAQRASSAAWVLAGSSPQERLR
jgi:hypothetical protein